MCDILDQPAASRDHHAAVEIEERKPGAMRVFNTKAGPFEKAVGGVCGRHVGPHHAKAEEINEQPVHDNKLPTDRPVRRADLLIVQYSK